MIFGLVFDASVYAAIEEVFTVTKPSGTLYVSVLERYDGVVVAVIDRISTKTGFVVEEVLLVEPEAQFLIQTDGLRVIL